MTKTAERLKIELSQLSADERAELASFLIDSLDEGLDDEIATAWDSELIQRLQEINSRTASGKLSSEILAELREKYS
jgi:hypothetical protein